MHFTNHTLKIIDEKVKENYVLCIGFGNNPYFQHHQNKKQINTDIFIYNEKSIFVSNRRILDQAVNKDIPIFMSRVFEHLYDYAMNISHLTKITNKLYLVVPDMEKTYKQHLKKSLKKIKDDGYLNDKFYRDTYEIISPYEEDFADLHAIWTDKNSMMTLLPEEYFSIIEMEEIDDINGYPHLFYEVEIIKEMSGEDAVHIFNFNEKNQNFDFKANIVNVKSLTISSVAGYLDDESKLDNDQLSDFMKQMATIVPGGNILVYENYLGATNIFEVVYGIYNLSSLIQQGGLVIDIEYDCEKVIQKLINHKYFLPVEYFKLNNRLFSPNHHYAADTKRCGWSSDDFMKIAWEQEKLFREIDCDEIESRIEKDEIVEDEGKRGKREVDYDNILQYIMCLKSSLGEDQILRVFEKL